MYHLITDAGLKNDPVAAREEAMLLVVDMIMFLYKLKERLDEHLRGMLF